MDPTMYMCGKTYTEYLRLKKENEGLNKEIVKLKIRMSECASCQWLWRE